MRGNTYKKRLENQLGSEKLLAGFLYKLSKKKFIIKDTEEVSIWK